MPLPLLIPIMLGLGAAAGIGVSVKNVVEGSDDRDAAESIANSAKSLFETQETQLNTTKELLYEDAAEYGILAYETKAVVFDRFVEVSKRMGEYVSMSDFQKNVSKEIDVKVTIKDFQKEAMNANEILGTMGTAAAASVSAGLAVGPGVAAAAGLFGTAGTGTAIGTLSGAAATNATLAWLGGGTLAAGGGGMAAGALMLGGVTLAAFTLPAALIGSWSYKAKGEEMLTQAYQHRAKVEAEVEKMKGIQVFLKSVRKQIQETQSVVEQLSMRADRQMDKVEQMIEEESGEQKTILVPYRLAYRLCEGIKEILNTNVLDTEGNFNPEISRIVQKYKMELING